MRVVVILDVGSGQEALLFNSQQAADKWEDTNPGVSDCIQGVVPLTTRADVLRAV